ncbi:hypothetical protein [Chimaeribacter arupi]|uniref:hypothetical protein n=1 Tax=Chimaeribacter arupi TaxID=2060066 RepID=UPI000C7D6C48|nr:hypothetical protein [Chimaeribacter arupi]PLR52385.1 hypothetical protein CYR52_07455 [Chimaeribacter arupi]
MSEFKGTPGPWNVQFGDEIYAGSGVDNVQVATVNDCRDAALISASPKLLFALQNLMKAMEYGSSVGLRTAERDAREAISQALGQ